MDQKIQSIADKFVDMTETMSGIKIQTWINRLKTSMQKLHKS